MSCQFAAKESIGSSPTPVNSAQLLLDFYLKSAGLKDNKNEEKEGSCIGNSWLDSTRKHHSALFQDCSQDVMPNSPGPVRRKLMYGRKTLGYRRPSSNLGPGRSRDLNRKTGKKYGMPQPEGISLQSPQMLEFVVTAPYEEYLVILLNLPQLRRLLTSTGDLPEPVKAEEPGMKAAWTLILKIQEPSFGVDIKVRDMLSLMNFEEQSTLPIFYGGWIVTQSLWRLKVDLSACKRLAFGSLPTSIQMIGTKI